MATYNGSAYLLEQIESIIKQLVDGDELIIVDDSSTDLTVDIIRTFNDNITQLEVNEKNLGVNKSFERAIGFATNKYIFMADQDDIWCDGRVDVMLKALHQEDVNLVAGNSIYIDQDGKETFYSNIRIDPKDSKKNTKNILNIFLGSASYYGCAMAFCSELKQIILPFPDYIESHDLWIAKASILKRNICHIEDDILYRRIHHNNASVISRPMFKKIKSRIVFSRSIIELLRRYRKVNRI